MIRPPLPNWQLMVSTLFFMAPPLFCLVQGAAGIPDGGGNDDLKKFHDNAQNRHGDLSVLLLAEHGVQGAVFERHILNGRHARHHGAADAAVDAFPVPCARQMLT